MSGWDSYRAVYGAELRAAAREFIDHGWPVAEPNATTLLLITGRALDVLEVPASIGRTMCAQLRDSGSVVPVAATVTGTWWFPVSAGAELPSELLHAAGVVLHSAGDAMLAPPSEAPDGWVHWRVAPALSGYRIPAADLIFHAATDAVRLRADTDTHPGAQRSAGAVAVAGTRL
jgi:hypothetical protein